MFVILQITQHGSVTSRTIANKDDIIQEARSFHDGFIYDKIKNMKHALEMYEYEDDMPEEMLKILKSGNPCLEYRSCINEDSVFINAESSSTPSEYDIAYETLSDDLKFFGIFSFEEIENIVKQFNKDPLNIGINVHFSDIPSVITEFKKYMEL